MNQRRWRLIALLPVICLLLSVFPAAAFAQPDAAAGSDEARWEQYWAQTPPMCPEDPAANPPKRGTSTSLSAMRARAEALVSYIWTPTTDISTWNGSSYNGRNYFPAGQPVRGVPYTLFTSEIVYWGLCSLEQYEEVASINYSTTAYCASVGAVRTGPVYGSCCADLVSEVLGGSFLYGRSPRYHNVGGIKRSPHGTTLTGQKMADIRPGDALSDVGENHVIWIGDVTDTTFTLYEQTPPAARKRILNKADYTNDAGYFIYNGKEYSIITRSNELISGPPRYAVLSTDKHAYAPDDTVTFLMNTDGTENTLRIFCPDGTTMDYRDAGESCQLSFRMSGHFEALVETRNEEGALTGARIEFVIGPPTRSILSADRPSCAAGESLDFSIDADGDVNTLWIYYPNGICKHYQDGGASRQLRFDTPGHYQAVAETRNAEGVLRSEAFSFTVGPPTFAALTADKTVCRTGDSVTFTMDTDGDEAILLLTCPDGSQESHPADGKTLVLDVRASGLYEAVLEARNPAGVCRSAAVYFDVECDHSYGTQPVSPGCDSEGCTLHVCTVCGDSYREDFTAPAGHDYRFAVTAAPTETHTGVLTGTCNLCGNVFAVPLPPISEEDYSVETLESPTCSAAGKAVYTWNSEQYGKIRFDADLPMPDHSFEDAVVEPTCTESGYVLRVCAVCGTEIRDRETPPLGHEWGEGTVTTESTQTDFGVRTFTCTRCGETRTEPVPPAGHEHSFTEKTVEPACTEPGYTLLICESCGYSFRDGETPAPGHSFGAWEQTQAATCTQDGIEQRLCEKCGVREERPVPMLDHIYEERVIEPACTEPGCTVHTCARCGESYADHPTEPTGHSYAFRVTANPTDGRPGTLSAVCSLCGRTTDSRTMPALNDEDYTLAPVGAATCSGPGSLEYTWITAPDGPYSFSVPIAAAPHEWKETVTAPSCTRYGYTTFTCAACGIYTSALPHSWNSGTVTIQPTPTAAGTRTYVCDLCGEMTTEAVPPLVHEHVYAEIVTPATCTQAGYTLYQCSCGVNYIDEEVPALGHDWDEGVVSVEPTWAAPGELCFTCTRCGKTRTQKLPKLWDPSHPCDGGETCSGRVFDDMPPAGNWAHDPIDWAIDREITSGTSETAFSPNAACTRAQVVTFLWRAAGSPAPSSADSAFTDVKPGSFYETAVAWAVEQEITKGMDETHFRPDATCTRGQIVTFLWRFCGSPAADPSDTFADLKPGAFYCGAVAWAVAENVTNGTSASTFSPDAVCTRAQVVTFLCRAVNRET